MMQPITRAFYVAYWSPIVSSPCGARRPHTTELKRPRIGVRKLSDWIFGSKRAEWEHWFYVHASNARIVLL